MSLRDQLLKAGLVDSSKLKKVELAQKKQKHNEHKDKHVKAAAQAKRSEDISLKEAYAAAQRARDQELNAKLMAEKRRKESRAAARQLLVAHRQNDKTAEDRFNFCPDGKKIRFVLVTPAQRILLGRGELAICRNDKNHFDYPLVSREVAEKLLALEQTAADEGRYILFLNDVNNGAASDEWADWPTD